MKNIWKIIQSDWKRISHNIVALLVLIGLAVIPSLYAWFNILSNWDPYGSESTSHMQIAVYSDDAGVKIESFELCVGNTIIENLRKNDSIGWVFSNSKEEALQGVYSGEYYAALIIPDTFTADMISFMSGEIENPKIQYYENSKKNAIATKITSKVKTSIQQEVNAGLIRMLAEGLSETGKTLAGDDKGESSYYTVLGRLEEADDSLRLYMNLLESFVNLTGNAGEWLQVSGQIIPDVYAVADKGSASLDGVLESAAASGDVVNAVGLLLELNLDNAITSLERLDHQLKNSSFSTDYSGVVNAYDTDLPDRSGEFDKASGAIGDLQDTVNKLPEELPDLKDDFPDKLPELTDQADWTGIADAYSDTLKQVKIILSAMNELVGESKAEYQFVVKKYEELQREVDSLATHADMTTADADEIRRNLEKTTAETITGLKKLKDSVDNSLLPDLREKTATAVSSIQEAKAALDAVQGDFDILQNALDTYRIAVIGSKEGIDGSLTYLKSMEKALGVLIGELKSLSENDQYKVIMNLLDNRTEDIAQFMNSPIALNTVTFYEIANNGSAMAPFYTVLALWVGALLLVAMVHTGVKPRPELAGARFYHRFLGRYTLFFVIAEVQALITSLGVLFFVGIQCLQPELFVLGCLIISFCFSLIMYSLTYGLGNIGEGVAVIILVLQVAGGGGTFPVEVLPELYQMIYNFLPFPYALDAIRETVGGMYGNLYWKNLGILLGYSGAAAVVCLFLERATRRTRTMLDKSKKATGVMK